MSRFPLATPSAGGIATQLARLYGPAWQAGDDTLNAADDEALGTALEIQQASTQRAVDNAWPSSSIDLLSEWEFMLGLPSGKGIASDGQRRTWLVARARASFAATPDNIVVALTPLNGDVAPVVVETSQVDCQAVADAGPPRYRTAALRRVFSFSVYMTRVLGVAQPFSGLGLLGQQNAIRVAATLNAMSPAHVEWCVTTNPQAGFFCNKATSTTNNTVL